MEIKKLNLGCGTDYKEGWTNTDKNRNVKADKYFDLNRFLYPFKDDSFDFVLLSMVLEHVDSPLKVLEELWRICKDRALIHISVPHWSSYIAYTDMTHKNFFSGLSFHYFEVGNPKYYSNFADFKIVSKTYRTLRTNNKIWKPFEWLCKYILEPLVNVNPLITEQILCKFLPVNAIDFVLQVNKKEK